MTLFLATDENPEGYKLEDILSIIRQDILERAGKIAGDGRPRINGIWRCMEIVLMEEWWNHLAVGVT